MPFTSLVAALGYKTADSWRGAQWPFWLMAGLLPLLSAAISQQLSGARWQAWTAALFTTAGGFYAHWFSQPATFAPFAWAGGLCLYALARGQRSRGAGEQRRLWAWWLVAGLMAGVAHLTRADGVLLLVVGVWVWLLTIESWHFWRLRIKELISNLQSLISLFLGYLLVMGGWFIHNWQVLGRPLPTVGTQTLFLRDYDDLFAYGRSFNLHYFLDWGWGNILQSKWEGVSLSGQTFVAVSGLIFLTPFIVWAWLKLGRGEKRGMLRPFAWYTFVLYAVMSLVFTLPGGRGGLFHSSAAIWPWMMALAAVGLGLAVDWFAARLSHWQPERAKRMFAGIFVGIAFIMSFAIGLGGFDDDQEAQIYEAIGARLPPDAVVMVGNAPGFYYHTGLSAVSIPNEPIPILLEAASAYHVTYLVLDVNRPRPLISLYEDPTQSPQILLIDRYEMVDAEENILPVYLFAVQP
jgi:hypothetical protein